MGLFSFLKASDKKQTLQSGLAKTRQSLLEKVRHAILGKSSVDDEVLDRLEEGFIQADVGVDTTLKIIDKLRARVAREKYVGIEELTALLKEEVISLLPLPPENAPEEYRKPYVILVVGVNGVGKTTTVGKLAWLYGQAGKKVILGAADTFRAAAVDQLKIWSERSGAYLVQKGMGADPASVAFDTLNAAKARQADIVIIDTAGRLHNKKHLMDELTKVRNVMKKVIPDAPHEVMLILDGSTGQNAFEQARQFTAATQVNSLTITKLDGTAKGGVVLGVADTFKLPVRFIGVGEKPQDLQPFDREAFVDSLFEGWLLIPN
ncbi:MAG: signal recognition particle-docking protein FtsY [Flavobacteriales bacterium]|nr:signal recognition particle-docking protein FtsY [Flavobacteriales bacterium]MCX7767644.1 signal recognition particle-docking protein FtsY [Flavobacteriales bacterium]MDW8409514.1 signal recognition particle-docking protein FtsY [Flavobacteriales bacterium]